jgi:hypothetical protein
MNKQEEPQREKTLHELNMEQSEINREMQKKNKGNPLASLPADLRRSIAKRMQKPVRAPIKVD